MKIGDRVGAIVSSDAQIVRMFGYGTYQGTEVPPAGTIGPFGEIHSKNPKIQLDDGSVVWGCECWWGPEEMIKGLIRGREVVFVTPSEYRGV